MTPAKIKAELEKLMKAWKELSDIEMKMGSSIYSLDSDIEKFILMSSADVNMARARDIEYLIIKINKTLTDGKR